MPISTTLAGKGGLDSYRMANYYELDAISLNPRDHYMATRMSGPLSYSGFLGDD